MGLERGQELQLGSPFDYAKQCTMFLEVGLPLPDEPGFLSAAMERAMHYLRQTQGRAFVLFTSYAMLDKAARILEPQLAALGYPMLAQGAVHRAGSFLRGSRTRPTRCCWGRIPSGRGWTCGGIALECDHHEAAV